MFTLPQSVNRRLRVSALILTIVASALLPACAVISSAPAVHLQRNDSIALLPIINLTETPQAGAKAEAIVEALLQAKGFSKVKRYAGTASGDALFQNVDNESVEQAGAAAHGQNVKYGLTGAVAEWRYKVGVDGEPAVGISLKLINLETNEVLWATSGSRSGWSRDAVSGIAQKLLGQLLGGLTQ